MDAKNTSGSKADGAAARQSAKTIEVQLIDVRRTEIEEFISPRRTAAGLRPAGDNSPLSQDEPTVGLALSGGGIRSASLSLGFVQGLQKYGLLRYADYLSAISGGSYTGAMLASSFHRATKNQSPRPTSADCPLDIDLSETSTQPTRVRALANDGRYLVRQPLEWANRFFFGWLLLFLFIGCGLLAASVFVAFVWRSMDFYTVRYYLEAMGLGGDMWAALLPLLALVLIWLACWTASRIWHDAAACGFRAKKVLILLIVCTVTTVAGLIGNGDISLTAGSEPSVSFLRFPIVIMVLLGLLPFLFRDKLFKSGRQESSLPERVIFRYTAMAVIIGIPMLLIGYFARENVSGFSTSRDGRLLIGDIKDFGAFASWFEKLVENDLHDSTPIGLRIEEQEDDPDPVKNLLAEIRLLTEAQSELSQRIAGRSQWRADPSPPANIQNIGGSEAGDKTVIAAEDQQEWKRAAQIEEVEVFNPALAREHSDGIQKPHALDPVTSATGWASAWWKLRSVGSRLVAVFWHDPLIENDPLEELILARHRLADRQAKLLDVFNECYLSSPRFGRLFERELFADTDAQSNAIGGAAPDAKANEESDDDKIKELSEATRERLVNLQTSGVQGFATGLIELHRDLLESFRPELFRKRDDIRRMVVIHADQTHRFLLFLGFAAVCLVSGWWINPNTTSIQRYYQERLAAAYLGGFDDEHNVPLSKLQPEDSLAANAKENPQPDPPGMGGANGQPPPASNAEVTSEREPRKFAGPLLIIGGTANYRFRATDEAVSVDPPKADAPATAPMDASLPADATPAPRTAKIAERVDNFEFSPLFCGSTNLGFVKTDAYRGGDVRLAEAVAISGAALNPMYFERWEMLAMFVMLNLRLGQWLPNPSPHERVLRRTVVARICDLANSLRFWSKVPPENRHWNPTCAILLRDLIERKWLKFRISPARDCRHILVTDGGHFDNLGLQSLLERRCKIILVCDGTYDPDYKFNDLAHVLGRMKRQAGVTLHEIGASEEIDLRAKASQFKDGRSHFFCGEIKYENGDSPSARGLLIYFKSSLTGDEPPHVWNHAANDNSFPHDSTLNQSFLPEQFWAYAGLGQHFVDDLVAGRSAAIGRIKASEQCDLRSFAKLFLAHIEKSRRDEFLVTLFTAAPNDEVRRAKAEYIASLEKLCEAAKAHNWQEVATAIEKIDPVIKSGELQPLPQVGRLLDALGTAIAALIDDHIADAKVSADVRRDAVHLFAQVLFTGADAQDLSDSTPHYDRVALHLRQRLANPAMAAAIPFIVRHPRILDELKLLATLIPQGDRLSDIIADETLTRAGEKFVCEGVIPKPQLRQLIQQLTFGDSPQIARRARRLLKLIELHEAEEKQAQQGDLPHEEEGDTTAAPNTMDLTDVGIAIDDIGGGENTDPMRRAPK